MNSNRKRTIIAGSLYFIGTIAGVLSIAPAVDASDYLLKASSNANLVLLGALFQFIMTIAYIGILIMFQKIEIITSTYIVLNLPLILLEIVLAIWLIAKGIDPIGGRSVIDKE